MARYSSAIPGTRIGGSARNGLETSGGYRWRGTPGWNPAATPADPTRRVRRYNAETLALKCVRCDAEPGRRCHGPTGNMLGQPHYDRWAGDE